MAGLVDGKLDPSSAANLGTDLSDDHPISFPYSTSFPANVEMVDSADLPAEIKLDPSGAVQCTSCHDPHGTEFDKFLVASLTNAALCTACHAKRYWDGGTPIHSTSTSTWNETGTNPWHLDLGAVGYADDTPEMHSCLSCHRSHGGAAGMTLAKGENPSLPAEVGEEWACLSCHNGNMAADIESYFSRAYSHPVTDPASYGIHSPNRELDGDPARELPANLDINNRHAECADCHNPHGAKSGNHAIGGIYGNEIGDNLLGGWGVRPTVWPSNGPGADNTVLLANYFVNDFDVTLPGDISRPEGYLCLKCHTAYSFGTVLIDRPEVPSGNADNSLLLTTDVTSDFNPNNLGYHPVFAQGANTPPIGANTWWTGTNSLTETFVYAKWVGPGLRTGFYNVTHESTITCTDCHGADMDTDLKGPHGSSQKWMVRTNEVQVGASASNLCFNCHRSDVYGDEDNVSTDQSIYKKSRVNHPFGVDRTISPFYDSTVNTYSASNSNKFGNLCLTCHGGAYAGDSSPPTGTTYLKEAQLPGGVYTNTIAGIHGSNITENIDIVGDQALGTRLMNGACVKSYTKPTTVSDGELRFRVVTQSTDKVCNFNFGTLIIPMGDVNYDY